MRISPRARIRAASASLAALGLLLAAASPALAASGTPTTPTSLFNGYQNCSTDANSPTYLDGRQGVVIEGVPGDTDTPDNPQLTAGYQVWPVTDPAQTTTLSHTLVSTGFEGPATVPSSVLADGQTYAWRAQTVAGSDASAWSAPCYFTVDDTVPAKAPTISSSNYPQGQPDQGGAPVQFTLDANGVSDVAGFVYSWQGVLPVPGTNIGSYGIPQPSDPYSDPRYFARATTLGGSASVSLVPPTGSGPMTLSVASLDRAFNESAMSTYQFFVKSTAPTVTSPVPSPEFDRPTTFLLKPDAALQTASPVTGYSVQILGGQSQQTVDVKASDDGTAEVTLTLNGTSGNSLQVSSRSEDGWVSDAAWLNVPFDTTPTVSSDVYPENGSGGGAGVPGTFSFTPKVKDVVSYTYSFNWGTSETVPADGDGKAQLSWTPDQSGSYDLQVYATTRDGLDLASYDYSFTVN